MSSDNDHYLQDELKHDGQGGPMTTTTTTAPAAMTDSSSISRSPSPLSSASSLSYLSSKKNTNNNTNNNFGRHRGPRRHHRQYQHDQNNNNNNRRHFPCWWKIIRQMESVVPVCLLIVLISTVCMVLTLHQEHTENANILPEYPTERDMKMMMTNKRHRQSRSENQVTLSKHETDQKEIDSHGDSNVNNNGNAHDISGGLSVDEYKKLLDPKKVAKAREQQLRIQKQHQHRAYENEKLKRERIEKENADREANNTYYNYRPPTFELPTNYEYLSKKWHEGTADQMIPVWMKNYFDWHAKQIVTLTAENWQDSSRKYLVLRCYRKDERCGGLSDRLKPVPLVILAANISQRILFIHWDRPVALEEFLTPPDNGLQWRVPSWMDEEMHTISKMVVPRAQQLLPKVMQDNFMVHTHLHDARGGMTQYEEFFNDTSAFYDVFHDVFRLFFQPSARLQYAMEEKLLRNNKNNTNPYGHLLLHEHIGQYSVAHYRAEYGHEVQRHPKLTQPSFLRRVAMNAIRCASELQPMIKTTKTTPMQITDIEKASSTSSILQQQQQHDQHNLRFYENYSIERQLDQAQQVEQQVLAQQEPPMLPIIYFASDNPIAMQVARNVAKMTNYPIVIFDRDEGQPLHLDYYGQDPTATTTDINNNNSNDKPINTTNGSEHHQNNMTNSSSSTAFVPAALSSPLSNMPILPKAKDYYSTFIDLYLAGNGKCVSYGRGGFGRFASLLSYNASCNIKHTAKFWPAVCKGSGIFYNDKLSKYGKDLSLDTGNGNKEGVGVDPLLDGVEDMM